MVFGKTYYDIFNFVILNETLLVEMKNLITIIVRDISVVQKTNSFNMTTFKSKNKFALDIYTSPFYSARDENCYSIIIHAERNRSMATMWQILFYDNNSLELGASGTKGNMNDNNFRTISYRHILN